MKNNLILKKILTIVSIPILGFILLNLTFIFYALYQLVVFKFFPVEYNMAFFWYPIIKHVSFAVIILIISWFVFKSKLKDLYKAIYSTVPVAVILVTIGIFLYRWSIATYLLSALIYGAIILYLYRTKKSWIYYYSVTLVAVTLLIAGILGVDI